MSHSIYSAVAARTSKALKRCYQLLPPTSTMSFTATTTNQHLSTCARGMRYQRIIMPSLGGYPIPAATNAARRHLSYEENYEKRDLDMVLRSLDAPMRKPPEISQEEQERRKEIGRNYVIGCFNEHNERNHDLSCKIKMKQHAISMLPKRTKIKEEALKISDEMPPKWRKVPTWTPPIENFDPEMFLKKGEV